MCTNVSHSPCNHGLAAAAAAAADLVTKVRRSLAGLRPPPAELTSWGRNDSPSNLVLEAHRGATRSNGEEIVAVSSQAELRYRFGGVRPSSFTDSMAQPRFRSMLFVSFAAVATLLAASGSTEQARAHDS
jgi:hypothetical protein